MWRILFAALGADPHCCAEWIEAPNPLREKGGAKLRCRHGPRSDTATRAGHGRPRFNKDRGSEKSQGWLVGGIEQCGWRARGDFVGPNAFGLPNASG